METNIKVRMIDICCIIINYNTSQYTINCIESLIENTTKNISYEIVVIDNNSQKNDYNQLLQFIKNLKKDNLKLIRSKQNIGFGSGNMLGVQNATQCKYYAFINNDTLQVSENCLFYLKQFMDSSPDAGICSPQMLDEDKNFQVTIDHFSTIQREIIRRPILEFLFPKKYLNRKKRYSKPTKVNYVQGSFMFIKASCFNEIGGFDTNLFLYYEESDISRRLLLEKNLNTYLVPQLEYIHYKNASTEKNILIKIEQKISLLYYINFNY